MSSLLEIIKPLSDRTYRKGDLILQPEFDDDSCYIIREGFVRVYMVNRLGEEEVQLIYSTGELFPLYWILGRPASGSFFQAMTDCIIATIPQNTLLELTRTDIEAANCMLRAVTEQFAIYNARITNLSYKYNRERLAYWLLFMAARVGKAVGTTEHRILPAFSQQEIATSINMSRESVNRELGRFQRLGIVRQTGGKIIILQPQTLRQEVGDDATHFYFDT